ncbi:hypothetical protein LCM02_11635 [Lutimonas saemankumensis]|uniref:hypothetical protein n=1 Tax=Lutimonas saemankumensis TaxID=483016 RepID=UPI001CD63E34|nr:hypothetical protein [Lutimonas saemankumensis]MCA0933107.1 hypothetical protein [Lutimonas saemankumensis]
MAILLNADNELDAFYLLLNHIKSKGFKSNRYLEVSNCLLSINYDRNRFDDFILFKERYFSSVGETANISWKRAIRVYTTYSDRITKPSYLKRLRNYKELYNDEIIEVDQIENIIYELSMKPGYSLLTFSIFRPIDLVKKQRPGYVPCPVVGDFKFRKGELQLNVFFRSHDALNFCYPDIYFLRKLQKYVLYESQKVTENKTLLKGKVGSLNLHFSRVFLPLRMEMKKGVYVNGKEVEGIINRLKRNLLTSIRNSNESFKEIEKA